MELGEDELQAALREVEEETSLINIKLIAGYKEEIEYLREKHPLSTMGIVWVK